MQINQKCHLDKCNSKYTHAHAVQPNSCSLLYMINMKLQKASLYAGPKMPIQTLKKKLQGKGVGGAYMLLLHYLLTSHIMPHKRRHTFEMFKV